MLFDSRDSLAARAMIHRERPRSAWLRLLSQVLQLAEGHAELVRHAERPWASATFGGVRHTIVLAFNGNEAAEAGERFLAALPDHEFDVPGQVVADASVSEVNHEFLPQPRLVAEIELLLLEDI